VLTGQLRDELLIRVRLCRTQPVIEVNNRKDNPQFTAQFHQQPQQRDRINPAGNGYADAISGMQQFLPPNVRKHALREGMHATMVHCGMIGEDDHASRSEHACCDMIAGNGARS
jgi:hypothetical protein